MFGLEGDKKEDKPAPFVFDLEKELKDPKVLKEMTKKVEEKIGKVKTILRKGENKDEFDQFGVLLNGYTALLRVISRVNKKK